MSGHNTATPGNWTADDVPDQRGKTAVITGANTGIGFETAKVLVGRGATVVLACRDLDKAERAADRIGAAMPGARVEVVRLDLASLVSVRQAAEELRAAHPRLDLLVNNAGVMMTPFRRTQDGFELQLGINHLGHFALTGLLLESLLAVPGSRVVTVSSSAHRGGVIDVQDLRSERGYRRTTAYARSKLANLLFTYELQRRLAASGASTTALAVHPGGVTSGLQRHMPLPMLVVSNVLMLAVGQRDAGMGALASLRAATDPAARGGEYYGPDRGFGFRGYPVRLESSARSHDAVLQRRLWEESERLTAVRYRFAMGLGDPDGAPASPSWNTGQGA
jgi:NAD(P)-dependent dehydrogenase (short-subunit alcohol dehydrogenase family)